MDTLLKNTRDWLQTSTRRSFSAVLEEAKITPRQVEICELKFVKGLTNYQIAMQLNVSVKTVDKELNTAYKQITNVLSFLNIDAVRYENARNTCDIVNAVKEDGEKTRAVLIANQIQDLRDKLADRDRDLQTANFQLSQQAQSAALIGTLRPYPQPAYITNSPYQSIAANVAGACGCTYNAG